ncbi:ras gtpase-activating protein [Anaeramoeba flamelloides]|uniref:Ras gtpase-activating protein n=1 Tax=Anaeramoeba flamelloides TaxID=1746091 RepID=A0ABQ8YZC6_9EUKA|nr:ras gtpase-activating protein [Anaeramoeba flamelloides]
MSEVDDFLKKISSNTKKQTTNTNLDDILSKFRTFSVNSDIEINKEILNGSQQSEILDQQTTNFSPQTNVTTTDIDEILNKTKTNSVLGNSNNYLSNDLPDFQKKEEEKNEEKEKNNLVGLQEKKKTNFSIDSLLGLSTNNEIEEEEEEEHNLMISNQLENQQQSTKNESQIYKRSIDDILHHINYKKKPTSTNSNFQKQSSNQIDELLNRVKNSKSSENQNYQEENQTTSYKSDIEKILEKKENKSNFNNNNEDENNLNRNQGNSLHQDNSFTSIDDILSRTKSLNVQSSQYSNNLKKNIQNQDQIQTNENNNYYGNHTKDNENENKLKENQNNNYNENNNFTSIDDILSRTKSTTIQSSQYSNNLNKSIQNSNQIQTNENNFIQNNSKDNENENKLKENQNNNYNDNNSFTSIDAILSRTKSLNIQSSQYSNNLKTNIQNIDQIQTNENDYIQKNNSKDNENENKLKENQNNNYNENNNFTSIDDILSRAKSLNTQSSQYSNNLNKSIQNSSQIQTNENNNYYGNNNEDNENENKLKENQNNNHNDNNSFTSIDAILSRTKSLNVQSSQYSNNLNKNIQNSSQIQTNENNFIQKNNSKDNENENKLKENKNNNYNENNSFTSIDAILSRTKSTTIQSSQYSNNLNKSIQNSNQIQTNENNNYYDINKDNENENKLKENQNNNYNDNNSFTSIDALLSRTKSTNIQSSQYSNNLNKNIQNSDQIQTNENNNYYDINSEDNENENKLKENQNNNYNENNNFTSIDDILSRTKSQNVQSSQYSNNLDESIENANNLLASNIPEQINNQKSINTQNGFGSDIDQFIKQISDNSSNNSLIDNLINQNNRFESQNESNIKQNSQTINEPDELESYQYQDKEQEQEQEYEQLKSQEKEEENNKMNQKTYSNNNSIYSNDIEYLLSRAKSSKKINENNFSTKEKETQETINNILNIQQEQEQVQDQETKFSNDYKNKYTNKIDSLLKKNKKKKQLRKINTENQDYRNSSFDEIDRLVSLAKLTNLTKSNENLENDFIENTENNEVEIEKTNSNLKKTNKVSSFENENNMDIESKSTEEINENIKLNGQETEREREREKEKEIKQLMNIYKNKQNEYLQLKNKLDDLDKEDEEFENNKKNNKSIEINIENNNTKKSKALSILINLNDQLCKSHDQYQTNISYLIDHFDLKLKNNSMEVVNKLQEIFENNKNNKTRKLKQPFKSRKLLSKILNNYLRSLNLPYFREKILDKINEMINKDINIFEENTILIIKNKLIRLLKNTVLVDKEEGNIFNTLETIFNLFYFSTLFRKNLTRYLVNYLKMNNIINQFPKIHNKLKNLNKKQQQGENVPLKDEDDDKDGEDENDNNKYFINNLIENIFLEFDEYLYGYPEETRIRDFLTQLFTNLNLDNPGNLANDITINSFKMTTNIFFKELFKQLIDEQNFKEIELISKKILFEHGQVYSELIESCQATNLKRYFKKNDIFFLIALMEYTSNRNNLKEMIYKLSNNLFPLFNSLGITDELIRIGFTLSISTSNSIQGIFQSDDLLIKLMITYFKVEGKEYLKKIFKDLMDEILLNNVSFLITSNLESNEEKRIKNFQNLKYYLNVFGNKLYSSQNIFPIRIKNIFHMIHKLLTHKYTVEWIPIVSNIFFSYFIGLALNSPFQYGLVDKPLTDWQANQNFSILYESITHMTQNLLYENSNPLLYQLNDIITNVNRKRNMFLRIIVQQQNIQPQSNLEKNFFSVMPNQEELILQLIKKISIHISKFLKKPIDISNGEMAILNLVNQYNELTNRFSSIRNLNIQLSQLHNNYPSIFSLENN